MNKKLYAFWRYDLFPYVLGGEVKDMNEKGMVYIQSYQGWFRPILILPLKQGKEIHDKIKTISTEYKDEMKKLKVTKSKELITVCPQLTPFLQ